MNGINCCDNQQCGSRGNASVRVLCVWILPCAIHCHPPSSNKPLCILLSQMYKACTNGGQKSSTLSSQTHILVTLLASPFLPLYPLSTWSCSHHNTFNSTCCQMGEASTLPRYVNMQYQIEIFSLWDPRKNEDACHVIIPLVYSLKHLPEVVIIFRWIDFCKKKFPCDVVKLVSWAKNP